MENEKINKKKKEALRRLELFGFDNDFLEEFQRDFKPKVADGEISRDMNKFEEETLQKIYLKYPVIKKRFFPYYITKYYFAETERYYFSILHVPPSFAQGGWNLEKRLIKEANYTYMVESDITDPENITVNPRRTNIMKKSGNALYPIDYALYKEEAETKWQKMKDIYEDIRRNRHEEYLRENTHVYRSAYPGEVIVEDIIIEPRD